MIALLRTHEDPLSGLPPYVICPIEDLWGFRPMVAALD